MLITGIPSIFSFSANRLLRTTVLTMINLRLILPAIIHNRSGQVFTTIKMMFPRNEWCCVIIGTHLIRKQRIQENI